MLSDWPYRSSSPQCRLGRWRRRDLPCGRVFEPVPAASAVGNTARAPLEDGPCPNAAFKRRRPALAALRLVLRSRRSQGRGFWVLNHPAGLLHIAERRHRGSRLVFKCSAQRDFATPALPARRRSTILQHAWPSPGTVGADLDAGRLGPFAAGRMYAAMPTAFEGIGFPLNDVNLSAACRFWRQVSRALPVRTLAG